MAEPTNNTKTTPECENVGIIPFRWARLFTEIAKCHEAHLFKQQKSNITVVSLTSIK